MPVVIPAEMSSVIPAYTTPYIACRQSSCSVCHSEHQMSSTGHCSFVVPEQIQHYSVVPHHVHPVISVMNIGSFTNPSDVTSDRRSGNFSIKRLCTFKANSATYGYNYVQQSLAAHSLWNSLPKSIRSAETFATFENHQKYFFLKVLMLIVCIQYLYTFFRTNFKSNESIETLRYVHMPPS